MMPSNVFTIFTTTVSQISNVFSTNSTIEQSHLSNEITIKTTREDKIANLIHTISPSAAVPATNDNNNTTSPASLALQWLLYDDELQLDYDDPSLIQRYILTLFYYETGGGYDDDETTTTTWHECGYDPWEVNCTVEIDWWDDDPYQTHSRFLSPTHECTWYGVECFGEQDDDDSLPRDVVYGLYNYYNAFSGTLPHELSQLTYLEFFHISSESGGRMSGTIPKEFASLTNLYDFTVEGYQLKGSIPVEMFALPNLIYINVGRNSLSGLLPPHVGNATFLEHFYLFENKLTGTIPEEVGLLPFMQYLDFSYNTLTGSLPSTLSRLTHMIDLRAGYNKITGSIPRGLGNAKDMEILGFAFNNLNGTLPNDLFHLPKLDVLELSHNSLMGTIPKMINRLKSVEAIGLKYNKLTGTVPSSIGHLQKLKRLRLQGNELTGTMPSSVCDLDLTLLISDCTPMNKGSNIMIPEMSCSCCTHCCRSDIGICRQNDLNLDSSSSPSPYVTLTPTILPSSGLISENDSNNITGTTNNERKNSTLLSSILSQSPTVAVLSPSPVHD